jgi:ribosomal protein S18 acetylase RimI-like enzyme
MTFKFQKQLFTEEKLNSSNLREAFEFCEKNVKEINLSYEIFKNATIKSKNYFPELCVLIKNSTNTIIGFFMIVFRRSLVFKKRRNVTVLKFFVVDKKWRQKGLGRKMYHNLMAKVKNHKKKSFWMKLEVLSSQPDYIFPGLSPKLTPALLFLKSLGFKKYEERINLKVDLNSLETYVLPKKLNTVEISRATLEDKEELISLKFMPWKYRMIFWADEIKSSFQNRPITTFVAKEKEENKIIGWATHSVSFPGSFGPTGVSKKYRKKGIGKLLLKWCVWDLKQSKVNPMIIRWIDKKTLSFYSKSIGAKVSEIYWALKRRI